MPSTDEGLTGPGIQKPKPEEQDVNTDRGFAAELYKQAGAESLPVSAREMGKANSPHRKQWVQSKLDESQKQVDEAMSIRRDLDGFFSSPGQGDVAAGLEPPDDSPPAPAPVVDTAEVDRLKGELTAARGSLSEAQQHEATMLAYDSLEEAVDSTDVHNTLSELREHLPADQWSAFKLDAIGGGLVEPEELAEHEAQYDSERAFEQTFDQATKSAAEADALKQDQLAVLTAEQARLGLDDAAMTLHLQDVAEAVSQLGINFDTMPREDYESEIQGLSALVADARRAYRHAAFQEAVVGADNSVESGLTIMGQPVSPREPIEPQLDYSRMLAHSNRGEKVDVAEGVQAEARKSTDIAGNIAALARRVDRDAEARRARARNAGGF